MQADELEYAGFWSRVVAWLIDGFLLTAVLWLMLIVFYAQPYQQDIEWVQGPMGVFLSVTISPSMDFFISYIFPAMVIILFWIIKQTTPGKMVFSAKIVDAKTGHPPSVGQCIGRYLSYLLSAIPFFAGMVWVAFDGRKQGWHDKLAGTVVVRKKGRSVKSVSFDG